MKKILFSLLILGVSALASAQATKNYVDTTIVQFSGMVLADDNGNLVPVPFATVSVEGEGRGTYANYKGFFSLVARKGDKIKFSAIGFRSKTFTIPDTIRSTRFSMVQLLSADAINLPESVIFPWPDRDNFKQEFLAMDVTQDLAERARENIAEERLQGARERTFMDANENADYYLRQQAKSFYHIGQIPPMNIFNPMAWNEFFTAWKNGAYKNKNKDTKNIKDEQGVLDFDAER